MVIFTHKKVNNMSCPICKSENNTLLRNTKSIEKGFKRKHNYTWNIDIMFCLDCNNIYGIKS